MKSKKKYEIIEPIPSSPIGKGIPKDLISFHVKEDKEKYGNLAPLYEGVVEKEGRDKKGEWIIVKIDLPGWIQGKFIKIHLSDIDILHRRKSMDLRPKPNFWNGLLKKQHIESKRKELEEKGYFDYPDLDKKDKKEKK